MSTLNKGGKPAFFAGVDIKIVSKLLSYAGQRWEAEVCWNMTNLYDNLVTQNCQCKVERFKMYALVDERQNMSQISHAGQRWEAQVCLLGVLIMVRNGY
jgi:hypothetical protein